MSLGEHSHRSSLLTALSTTTQQPTDMLKRTHKLLSLTYKILTTIQPSYLHNLICLQPPRSTRFSSDVLITLFHLPTISSDRSFRYASTHLWNQLPDSFRLVSIYLHIHLSTYLSHHPLLLHSLTPGSKPTFFNKYFPP